MPVAVGNQKQLSISTSANLHVVNDPTVLEVDTLSVSLELFLRLFPRAQRDEPFEADKPKFVLIKFIGVPDYFDEFFIYRITSIDYRAPTSSSVTITNHSNLVKFKNRITVNSCVIQSIDESSIPNLSSVYVEVPEKIFNLLESSPSSAVKRFIFEHTRSNGNVVSQGSVLRAINGIVRLSEPFFQGCISSDTEIILVKRSETDHVNAHQDTQEKNSEPEIDISLFLSKSILLSGEDDDHIEFGLELAPLTEPMSLGHSPDVFPHEDTDLYAYINTDDLSKIGFPLLNGELAVLLVGDSKTVIRVFTVLEPNSSFAPGTIYVSPILLINLDAKNTKGFLKSFAKEKALFSEVFPTASTATISRVVSPITMDRTFQQSFLTGLKTAFHSKAKIVKQGDFIPICIDTVLAKTVFDVTTQQQQNSGSEEEPTEEPMPITGSPDAVAWFKVIEVGGETDNYEFGHFRIDPNKTALMSSGVEFTRSPRNDVARWLDYLGLPPTFSYSEAIQREPDHFKYAQEFERILKTTVETKSKTRLKTTILLNSMSRGLGKTTLVRSTSLDLGLNLIELDAFDFIKPGAELKTIGLLTGRIEKQLNGQLEASSSDNFHVLYIKHIENLCVEADPNEQRASSSTSLSLKVVQTIKEFLEKYDNMALVASVNDVDKLNENFRQIIKFQIDVPVPDEQERQEIFRFLLDKETRAQNNEILPLAYEDKREFEGRLEISALKYNTRNDIGIQPLALQSAGLTPRDLASIIRKAKQLAIRRLMEFAKSSNLSLELLIKIANGGRVTLVPDDLDKAISDARNLFSDSIGAPRIPNVKWEDIGGLDMVKDEILDTIDMPLKHPELFANGLKKRSGILFYGPPGTGKTLLAKAIASNFSLNFFSVKGPELLNMYIGESEANVRRVFQKARDAKPCVIFFDELDSVAPKRGNQGDSGGVMDRIVSQLLAELDGMSGGESNGDGVFVVGATNRPDLLDEALLRPGRFDKMLYLGISDTDEKQEKILEALTRKFKLSDEVDLAELARRCSFTLTGADFYALCSDSMLNAMTRTANEVDAKLKKFNQERIDNNQEEVSSRWWFDNVATPEDINVLVTMQDFEKAQRELAPSVSAEELAHYLRVKQNFEGGKEKVQSIEEPKDLIEELKALGHEIIDHASENGYDNLINGNGHAH